MLGWTITKENISEKQYNTSGFRSFVNRHTDSGFRTKWSGIWAPPIKAFEYLAYSINGEWLSPKNIDKCLIKPWGTKHIFTTGDISAKEIIFCPKDEPGAISILCVKNQAMSEKKITIELEAAINIREKQENVHDRKYQISANELRSAIISQSEIGSCIYGIGKTDIKPETNYAIISSYKSHNPGSPQVCCIPAKYTVTFMLGAGEEKKIPFIFAASKNADELIHIFDRSARKWKDMLEERVKESIHTYHDHDISTPDQRLDKAFLWSQYSTMSLVNKSDVGTGIFAGYPWFLEYWGRDTFWSLLGLIDAGEFSITKDIIKTLAAHRKKRIPCELHLDGSTEFHGADTDPLFLIALDRYEKASGDKTLRKELDAAVRDTLKNLELLDYMAVHKPEETWMDTLKREGNAVDIQALWCEALKTHEPKISMKMNTRLNRQFWNEDKEFYFDTHSKLPEPDATANALIPLFFGLTPKEKAIHTLERAKTELLGIYGIRTLSKTSRKYDPHGYHTGSSWGLTTAWGAVAFLRSGYTSEAIRCLDALAYDCEKFEPGAFSETIDSESGELLGTTHQAWSSALLTYAIDSHLFGIKPDMTSNMLTIEPKLPENWGHMHRHGKKVGKHEFDIIIERTETGLEIRLNFSAKPDNLRCRLSFLETPYKITINGKPFHDDKGFAPEKENTIICKE